MTQRKSDTPAATGGGLPMAVGAYLIWGLLPLYLRLVHQVPPFEFVGWRIVFTLPLCLAFIAARRQFGDLLVALRQPRVVAMLALSSLLIGANWLIYIAAIMNGHVFATSLGYYINPLVNVLIGTVFLHERLSRLQWAAVGIAAIGVVVLAWGARDMVWIALALAGSFSAYGVVRKLVPVGSLPGLTIESAILYLPAVAVVVLYAAGPQGSAMGTSAAMSLLIALSGVLTAVPLLLFALAARRMDLSTLGFVQFLSPTIVFVLGLTVFGEPLRPVQLVSFVLIWTAIALFVADLLRRRSAAKPPA
ncbi:EamA family transporter RarD [Parablastomonas sp. CN1-191]|uniref:EamA family transporter RarD n=1 Tax=Parablastomonas sp. CN1-191 TaxID=3400908 RepID=UPI003BF8DAC7